MNQGAASSLYVLYGQKNNSMISRDFEVEDGVQSEACHRTESGYHPLMLENTAKFKADVKGKYAILVQAGETIPTEENCVVCDNPGRPTHRPFVLFESL
jgi:hypothetical protein